MIIVNGLPVGPLLHEIGHQQQQEGRPAYYIILDFPEWDAMKVLKKSIEVMRGNKLRYVLLQISFLPALLLSVFTCGLTLIWVMPYMHMTNTNFYLDIMAVKNKNMNNSSY